MVEVYVLLALLLVYVVVAALAPTAKRFSRLNFVLGNVLFLLALALNWRAFRGTPPFRPVLIFVALVCGQVLYMFAVLATKRSLKEAISAAMPSSNIAVLCRYSPLVLLQYCFIATYEEFVWRATAQPFLERLFANAGTAVLVTACLFTLLHQKMFTHAIERVEFILFSAFLGLIYYLTSSLLFVVVVHVIRDINIKSKLLNWRTNAPEKAQGVAGTRAAEREPAVGNVPRGT
jgi:membrane protease YdiL (CAAX protease family)